MQLIPVLPGMDAERASARDLPRTRANFLNFLNFRGIRMATDGAG
jgi:hypothetical protein